MPTFIETTPICMYCLELLQLSMYRLNHFVEVSQSISLLACIFVFEELLLYFGYYPVCMHKG